MKKVYIVGVIFALVSYAGEGSKALFGKNERSTIAQKWWELCLDEENWEHFLRDVKVSQDFLELRNLSLHFSEKCIEEKDLIPLKDIHAPHLEELTLGGLKLCPWKIFTFPFIQNIKRLNFRKAVFPKNITCAISLPVLEELSFTYCSMENLIWLKKCNFPCIKKVSWTSVKKDEVIKSLQGFETIAHQVESLSIDFLRLNSFQGMLESSLEKLKYLSLKCTLSNTAVKELQRLKLDHVERLILDFTVWFGKGNYKYSTNPRQGSLSVLPVLHLPNVVRLNIAGVKSLKGFEKSYLPKLKVLELSKDDFSKEEQERILKMYKNVKVIFYKCFR